MITKKQLAAAQAELDAQGTSSYPTARETLDALPEDRASEPAGPATIQGSPPVTSPAVSVAAVPFSGPQCEAELVKMIEVQREVFTTLEEFLPCCAEASTKTRILVSELLRVTEEQSSFILGIKTQLAMRDLSQLRKS